jgi:hypothetical protein
MLATTSSTLPSVYGAVRVAEWCCPNSLQTSFLQGNSVS